MQMVGRFPWGCVGCVVSAVCACVCVCVQVHGEGVRVAGLLSHAPQELEVTSHARAVIRANLLGTNT